MEAEIAHLLTRQDGPDGFVYLLCVKTDGNYPCVNGSALFVELEAGDIWKIGETTQINGGRYSEKLLNSIGTGGVQQIPIIYGNQREIKIYEKYMIYGYYYKYGHLPPGNKIFR